MKLLIGSKKVLFIYIIFEGGSSNSQRKIDPRKKNPPVPTNLFLKTKIYGGTNQKNCDFICFLIGDPPPPPIFFLNNKIKGVCSFLPIYITYGGGAVLTLLGPILTPPPLIFIKKMRGGGGGLHEIYHAIMPL